LFLPEMVAFGEVDSSLRLWPEIKTRACEKLADLRAFSKRQSLAALGEEKIRESFDLNDHLKHVDTIYRRVFGN